MVVSEQVMNFNHQDYSISCRKKVEIT